MDIMRVFLALSANIGFRANVIYFHLPLLPTLKNTRCKKLHDRHKMSLSDSSSLSSPPSSDDEAEVNIMPQPTGLNRYFKAAQKPEAVKAPSSTPLPRRPASPPHEYVLADNADIAVGAYKHTRSARNTGIAADRLQPTVHCHVSVALQQRLP